MPRTAPIAALIEVRHSPIHGHGVFAVAALRRGLSLGRYGGRRLSASEVEAMDWNNELTYVFGLSDGSVIDGHVGGNATRHLNHSCEPNCAAFEVTDEDGLKHIEFETLRDIAVGEELLFDYQLIIDPADETPYTCGCGSPACRGTMVAPAEPVRPKRARRARRAG